MSLIDDIKEEIENLKNKKIKKEDKILAVKDEIILMLENNLSLTKQIELLIKNKIVDKIDLKYYREILKKNFNYQTYQTKKAVKKITFSTSTNHNKATQNVASTPPPTNQKSNIDVLSQDIDLKF